MKKPELGKTMDDLLERYMMLPEQEKEWVDKVLEQAIGIEERVAAARAKHQEVTSAYQ